MRMSSSDSKIEKYRAIQIVLPKGARAWKFIWGADIWFGKWPFVKLLVLGNLLMWLVFWWVR